MNGAHLELRQRRSSRRTVAAVYLPPSRRRPTAGVCERGGRLGSCRLSGMSITLLTPLCIAMQSLH